MISFAPVSKIRALLRFALVVGLVGGTASLFLTSPQIIRARSAASGDRFWLYFNHNPSEEEIFASLREKEPKISAADRNRLAPGSGENYFVRTFDKISVDVSPYTFDPAVTVIEAHAEPNAGADQLSPQFFPQFHSQSGRMYQWDGKGRPTEGDYAWLEVYESLPKNEVNFSETSEARAERLEALRDKLQKAGKLNASNLVSEVIKSEAETRNRLRNTVTEPDSHAVLHPEPLLTSSLDPYGLLFAHWSPVGNKPSQIPYWLTEPATRYALPSFIPRIFTFIGTAAITAASVFIVCGLLQVVWYFFIARLSEVAAAVRGK